VQTKVRAEIERHFKVVLNRPEILNRIGENVLVFDFIRADIANQIFYGMIESILAGVAEAQGITVIMDASSRERIRELCLADLSNGGRGIRNKVEMHLVNPLARALFDADARPGGRYEIRGVDADPGGVTTLHLVDPSRAGAAA
jgi:ATP-dependent Clp protease ATP-binding subunit ClpA